MLTPNVSTHRRVIALVSGLGWHVQDLSRAADRVDCDLRPVLFPTLSATLGSRLRPGEVPAERFASRFLADGADLRDCEALLIRMMPPGSLEQVVFRMDFLHRLEAEGRRIVNPPRAIEAAVDKFLTLARLELAGLPVPATWAGESADEAMDAFGRLGGDVVVKPLFGSEGRGLVRVSDRESAWRVVHALQRIGSVLYLQQFIRHDGTDLRVFVSGGRCLGTIRRRAAPGDWRANVAQGGRAEAVRADPALDSLAVRATEAVGAAIAGVDLLIDEATGEPVVVEVNAVPGWRAFGAATGIDVAAEVLRVTMGGPA